MGMYRDILHPHCREGKYHQAGYQYNYMKKLHVRGYTHCREGLHEHAAATSRTTTTTTQHKL